MIHDLEDCLASSSEKIQKRLDRFKLLLQLYYGYTDDQIQKHVNIFYTDNIPIDYPPDINSMITYCMTRSLPLHDKIYDNSKKDLNIEIRKYICGILTSIINNDQLYKQTSCAAQYIWYKIKCDTRLEKLVANKQILFVQKGSMAQRCVLMDQFYNTSSDVNKKKINTSFGCGGDNDCIIIIDPSLKNYATIHGIVKKIVLQEMLKNVLPFMTSLPLPTYGNVSKLETTFSSTKHPHIIIKLIFNNYNYIHYKRNTSPVYVSYNDSLNFYDNLQRKVHFTLIRYKYAMKIYKKILYAELLDIAIPYNDDARAAHDFCLYRSGKWITTINI